MSIYRWCKHGDQRMDEVACDGRIASGRCVKDAKKGCRYKPSEMSEEARIASRQRMLAMNAERKGKQADKEEHGKGGK